MIELKIGDLVQVLRGDNKGLIGHIHYIDTDAIYIVRLQEDIEKGLLPIVCDCDRKDLIKLYVDEELRYAAYERCACGAGMAYPKNKSFKEVNSWECSDILTGRALIKDPDCKNIHTRALSFAMYEIKSEDQPSANNCTTRQK